MFFSRKEPDNKHLSELSITVLKLEARMDKMEDQLRSFKGRFYQFVDQELADQDEAPEKRKKSDNSIKPFNPFA